jgi:hypothetical protein
VAKDVEAAILDRPRAREIEKEPAVLSLSDMRKRFPATLSEEEFLLRAVMPVDLTEANCAANRCCAESDEDNLCAMIWNLGDRRWYVKPFISRHD